MFRESSGGSRAVVSCGDHVNFHCKDGKLRLLYNHLIELVFESCN